MTSPGTTPTEAPWAQLSSAPSLLAVGSPPPEGADARVSLMLDASDQASLAVGLDALLRSGSDPGEAAEPRERFHAAILTSWGADVSPEALVQAVRPLLREGATLLFTTPTVRDGIRGARGALLGLMRRRRPVLLEDLCEALLLAGIDDIRVRELPGAAGDSLVWGTVLPEAPVSGPQVSVSST